MKKKLLLLGLLALNSFASDCKQDNLSKEETIECNQIARSTGEYAATYHKKTILKLDEDEKADLKNDEIEEICKKGIGAKEYIGQKREIYYQYYCAKGLEYTFNQDSKIKVNEFNDYKFDKYQVFKNYTTNIDLTNITKVEDIYFGERKDFDSKAVFSSESIFYTSLDGLLTGLNSGASAFAKNMASEGLKSGLAGLGIGVIFGSIDTYNKHSKKKEDKENFINKLNKEYILIEKITNSNNEQTQKMSLMVVQNNSSIKVEDIKKILKGETL